MKKSIPKYLFLFLSSVLFIQSLTAQSDIALNQYDSTKARQFDDYFSALTAPNAYDINNVPITICFIEEKRKYVGFIIAGHASKSVCEVASLEVKNFLDSVGYAENTIFTFGVGFDLCASRDSQLYDNKLRYLEKTFAKLRQSYFLEVYVTRTSYSNFKSLSHRIKANMALAMEAMQDKDSLNRVIFRYNNVKFPIPVPFYTKDSIVRFKIPKSDIGHIPSVRVFDLTIIDKAIRELETEISLNVTALNRLNLYRPDAEYLRFVGKPYYFKYSNRGKITLDSFLVQGVTSKYITITNSDSHFSPFNQLNTVSRYQSLEELKRRCDDKKEGAKKTIDVKGEREKITPCDALKEINKVIEDLKNKKNRLINFLSRVNDALDIEKTNIIQIKSKLTKAKLSGDSLILIDAFLRGWCLKANNQAHNTQLSNWYKKRESVWHNILEKHKEYKKTLTYKCNITNIKNVIAGIFHYDDVFFSVIDSGQYYVVTPYKMLSGNFAQIIDKKNSISQFVSENYFRTLKL